MSKLSQAISSASRRHKDVQIVLDGQLAQERAELVKQVVTVGQQKRLATNGSTAAQAALAKWDKDHADSVITVRATQCSLNEWREIQRKNPVAASKEQRDQLDGVKGFAVIPAALDAVERFGSVIIGGEEEQPTVEEWQGLWDAISPGDAYMIALAVVQVMDETTEQAFGDLVKR